MLGGTFLLVHGDFFSDSFLEKNFKKKENFLWRLLLCTLHRGGYFSKIQENFLFHVSLTKYSSGKVITYRTRPVWWAVLNFYFLNNGDSWSQLHIAMLSLVWESFIGGGGGGGQTCEILGALQMLLSLPSWIVSSACLCTLLTEAKNLQPIGKTSLNLVLTVLIRRRGGGGGLRLITPISFIFM